MEQHLPALIHDLGIILTAAGFITLLFKRLKQPVVLGYIIAGFLLGPHVNFFPTIGDLPNVKVWAEIGVIFLLFALGLEFSFKKLLRVGGSVTVIAMFQIVSMVLLGYLTGRIFNWSQMDSIFLGCILSMSSTTIIFRAFEEAGVKGRRFVNLVFGALIIEDLVAILLLVLLSTIAIKNQFQGVELAASVVKLVFFLTLWFLSGIFLIPSLLRKFRPYLTSETLLVLSIGLCFFMVILATSAGFSPALGAFIMGSIFAETTDAETIEHLISPVKNLFAAIFFISVGTLLDPNTLVEHAGPVLAITLVTIVGKTLSTTMGALLAGQSVRHSVQSGFSLAQIGEFSFIIAGLGMAFNVTSDFLYPITIAVSAITTLTTPYMIRSQDRIADIIEKRIPNGLKNALSSYGEAVQGISATSEWRRLLQAYVVRTALSGIVIAAIFLAVAKFVPPVLAEHIESAKLVNSLSLLLALLASTPFLWAWLFRQPAKQQAAELWKNPRYRGPILGLEVARFGSAIALFGFLAPQIIATPIAFIITLGCTVLGLVIFGQYWKAAYSWIEDRFITNLSERETAANNSSPTLAPWDAHIAKLEVSPRSEAIGKTLMENGIREKFGVTIALIERGDQIINAPMRNEKLYPFDRVSVIGTDEQIEQFRKFIEPQVDNSRDKEESENYSLHQVVIPPTSPFVGRTIRDSGIRESSRGLVVGIERQGQRFLNPDSTMVIEANDKLWIVGDRHAVKAVLGAS